MPVAFTPLSLPDDHWLDGLPASAGTQTGDWVFLAAQSGEDAGSELGAQVDRALDRVKRLLAQAGGGFDDILEVVSFHTDPREMREALERARPWFAGEPPAWTPVGFLGSARPGIRFAVRVVAHVGPGAKQSIPALPPEVTAGLPMAGGCAKDGVVFVAGQTAVGPDGTVDGVLDHVAQAPIAYERMLRVLAQAGGTDDDILDFTSFHRDVRGAIPTLEQVYMPTMMGEDRHADLSATTSHVGATGLLSADALGAYTAIADLSAGARVGSTPDAIWWKGVYPIAGAARKERGRLVTIAGQVASAADGSIVAPGDVRGQARYILDSMAETLAGFGLSMADVVAVNSFHKDARWWPAVMEVASDYFAADRAPAWTFAAMPGLWFEEYLHEISALAMVPE